MCVFNISGKYNLSSNMITLDPWVECSSATDMKKNLPITWPPWVHRMKAPPWLEISLTPRCCPFVVTSCPKLNPPQKKWKSSWITYIYIYHVQQVNPCKSTTEMSLFLAIHVCLPQDTQNHVEPRGLTEQIDGCGENTRKSIAFP